MDDAGASIENAQSKHQTREHLPRNAQHVRHRKTTAGLACAARRQLGVSVDRVDVLTKRAILDVIKGAGQPRRAPLDDQVLVHRKRREPRPLPAREPKKSELLAHCRAELPAYKIPRELRFVRELEQTDTGKLKR